MMRVENERLSKKKAVVGLLVVLLLGILIGGQLRCVVVNNKVVGRYSVIGKVESVEFDDTAGKYSINISYGKMSFRVLVPSDMGWSEENTKELGNIYNGKDVLIRFEETSGEIVDWLLIE